MYREAVLCGKVPVHFLSGRCLYFYPQQKVQALDKDDYSVEKYDNTGRQRPAKKSGVDKLSFRSDAGVFTEEQVKKETARCLGCGATIVDENQCVGCGICTTKCEFDAIHLQRDLPECSTMRRSEDKLKYILPYGAKQAIKIKFKKKKD